MKSIVVWKGRMPGSLLTRARHLGRHATPAESVLWNALRKRQLDCLKFVRQVPSCPHIVDFLCHSRQLVVEVDGATHADPTMDVARDRWLSSLGFRVQRFWTNGVMANIEGVLVIIQQTAAGSTSPAPFTSGGRKKPWR